MSRSGGTSLRAVFVVIVRELAWPGKHREPCNRFFDLARQIHIAEHGVYKLEWLAMTGCGGERVYATLQCNLIQRFFVLNARDYDMRRKYAVG